MATKDSVLPLENKSFQKDAKRLFSFAPSQLKALVHELDQHGMLFSTAIVARTLTTDPHDAKSNRYTVLALTHALVAKYVDRATFEKELVSVGCQQDKVKVFTDEVSTTKTPPEILAKNSRFLLDVIRYMSDLNHLKNLGVQFNYTL